MNKSTVIKYRVLGIFNSALSSISAIATYGAVKKATDNRVAAGAAGIGAGYAVNLAGANVITHMAAQDAKKAMSKLMETPEETQEVK